MAARIVREKVTALSPVPVEPEVPQKTWDQLTPEERDALMKKIAEDRGYVRK